MGLPVEVNNLMLGSLGGYTVGRSLRFRSSASAYLSRTQTAGSQTTWTWSGWVKRGKFTTAQYLMQAGGSSGSGVTMSVIADDFQIETGNGTTQYYARTTAQYRDPSAWYHVVMVCNTTSATSTLTGTTSDRLQIWINGVQVTSFSASSIPTQNFAGYMNQNTVAANIGRWNGASPSYYYDGYLAEVNFIDGQALTPTSFGAYDTNGVWQPKKYTGTYGTNGFYLPFSLNNNLTYQGSFNGTNQSLSVANNSAFNLGSSNFTIEAWVWRTGGGGATASNVLNQSVGGAASNSSFFFGAGNDGVALFLSTTGTSWTNFIQSSVGLNTNQWYHVVWQRRANTLEVYLNGVLQTSAAFSGTVFNSTRALEIGTQNGGAFFTGTISNLRMVTGSAVYNGNFVPPSSALTAISGTQLLTLQGATITDNSANAFSITNNNSVTTSVAGPFVSNISADASGNANNWLSNNISLSLGTTYDSMIDSPTNAAGTSNGIGNYAVMNPNFVTPSTTFSNGNLTLTKTGNTDVVATSTIAMPSGKWYWEITITSLSASSDLGIGIVKNTTTNGSWVGALPAGVYFNSGGGVYRYGSNITGTLGTTFATNDILGLALDMDAGTLALYKNNTLIYTVSGVDTTTPHYAFWDSYANGESASFNFGQRPFSYTPPSGYKALNTYNLPAPSIANGAQYMAATTYTGNGSTQSISNVVNGISFAPDMVWVKGRNEAYYHRLTSRGITQPNYLSTNSTDAEGSVNNTISSLDSNGFTVDGVGTGGTNESGINYIGWQWKAGGTGVTNTSGTITSTVSASPSSGFSIATYTGNGTAGSTVGHGLGVAPNLVIWKKRSSTGNWFVWSKAADVAAGSTRWGYLNATNAFSTSASTNEYPTYKVDPTSTVLTLNGTGSSNGTNDSSATYVAYCFSAVSGYSAMGSYTGNGSSDGPFVFTGFRPRFVLFKNASASATPWIIFDTTRNTYNEANLSLQPEVSDAEKTNNGWNIDILSNGFKVRNTSSSVNGSGNTITFAAFAENPFNISRAR